MLPTFRPALLALLFAAPIVAAAGAQTVSGRFIVTYRNGFIPADAESSARLAGAALVHRHERLGMAILTAPAARAEATRQRLARQPEVETIVEDRIVNGASISPAPATVDPDPLYHSQQGWAQHTVGGYGPDPVNPLLYGPWKVTKGAGVRIAILDSGLDAAHPDLAPNLALNLTEIDQTALPSACDDGTPQDQSGHGSWTASLAAGALGAGTGLTAGVAPQATLLNVKVLERMPSAPSAFDPTGCTAGQPSGLLSWVIQGIDDAVANRADIISMSLGTLVDLTTGEGAGLKTTFDHATHAAAQAGVIVIASAGNDGYNLTDPRYIELPAQARDVLAIVAATNPACAENTAQGATCAPGPVTLPYYSNYGAPLNALAAPGGSYPAGPTADPTQPTGWILGACSQGKPSTLNGPVDATHSMGCFGLGHTAYVQAMGTSAAAPLAAGVAALIRAANPTWSAAAVVAYMRQTATVVPGLPVPEVNAAAAVKPAALHINPVSAGLARF